LNLEVLGERQVILDCDVLQADGGTRTAAINGSYVALVDALDHLKKKGLIEKIPLKESVAAVSVGIVKGLPLLDLCYEEDSGADVDFNVVMTASGRFVEIQGTAEKEAFTQSQLDDLLKLALVGIRQVMAAQDKILQ
jgi:ribonuclease PH